MRSRIGKAECEALPVRREEWSGYLSGFAQRAVVLPASVKPREFKSGPRPACRIDQFLPSRRGEGSKLGYVLYLLGNGNRFSHQLHGLRVEGLGHECIATQKQQVTVRVNGL